MWSTERWQALDLRRRGQEPPVEEDHGQRAQRGAGHPRL